MQNTMEVETTRRMAPLLYSYIGRDTKELVHRPRNLQRHYRMGSITTNFVVNFSFENENPNMDSTMKLIQGLIFFEELEVEIITKYQQHNRQTVNNLLSCYHVTEEAPNEDDPCNIQIIDIEGEREGKGPSPESEAFPAPIKVKKFSIGTKENPKMESIGDY
jgi:hypothetical protein